jgi:hypothetical protein
MKYRSYPLGHPRVLTRELLLNGQECAPLPWTQPEHNPFKGFILCHVLAPTAEQLGERKALLPYRCMDDRLVFPLCAECADRRQQHRPCRHTDQQRSWYAGFTHVELNRALAIGYRVTELHEA